MTGWLVADCARARERPRCRRTTDKRDEVAPPHSVPSQAEGLTLPAPIALCITANEHLERQRWVRRCRDG